MKNNRCRPYVENKSMQGRHMQGIATIRLWLYGQEHDIKYKEMK